MSETMNQPPLLQRLPSGISGLDRILQGGFFRGGSYILLGPPGAGKTVLGNQLCFQHVATGGRALYLTLLTETYSRMLAHLRSMTFYTPTPLGETLHYLSGYRTLEQEGLEGLMSLLRAEVRRLRASLLVLDGAVLIGQSAPSVPEWKRFLHALYVSTEFLLPRSIRGTTALAENLLLLRHVELSSQLYRLISILKMRESGYDPAMREFRITKQGIEVAATFARAQAILTGVAQPRVVAQTPFPVEKGEPPSGGEQEP